MKTMDPDSSKFELEIKLIAVYAKLYSCPWSSSCSIMAKTCSSGLFSMVLSLIASSSFPVFLFNASLTLSCLLQSVSVQIEDWLSRHASCYKVCRWNLWSLERWLKSSIPVWDHLAAWKWRGAFLLYETKN